MARNNNKNITQIADKAVRAPSIGRFVIHTDSEGVQRPAIITEVRDERLVVLAVQPRLGEVVTTKTAVFSEEGEGGTWNWPKRAE